MKRRSTKEKMAIPTPMKTEQSWNGLCPAVAATDAAADDTK
jgi:hypothetical protein